MKKILFAVMACVLCLGLMGGAFAWFTDVEKSTGNTMGAGTLDIEISDGTVAYSNNPVIATFTSPAGLAPGDSFTTNPVYLKNVGTINIHWIFARFCALTEAGGVNTDAEAALTPATDISKYLILQSYEESGDGGANWYAETFDTTNADAYLTYWNGRSAGTPFILDGEISLWDLYVARNYGSGDHVTSLLLFDGGNYTPVPPLPTGGIAAARFTFKLAENTPNNYQGDTATFEVDFIASANPVYPDDTLVESGLEPLGP